MTLTTKSYELSNGFALMSESEIMEINGGMVDKDNVAFGNDCVVFNSKGTSFKNYYCI